MMFLSVFAGPKNVKRFTLRARRIMKFLAINLVESVIGVSRLVFPFMRWMPLTSFRSISNNFVPVVQICWNETFVGAIITALHFFYYVWPTCHFNVSYSINRVLALDPLWEMPQKRSKIFSKGPPLWFFLGKWFGRISTLILELFFSCNLCNSDCKNFCCAWSFSIFRCKFLVCGSDRNLSDWERETENFV